MYPNVHLLSLLYIQNMKRGVARVDHVERASIGGVIVAEEGTVVDGETVSPEVKFALDTGRGLRNVRVGAGDGTRGSVVAAERRTGAAKVLAVRVLVITARAGRTSRHCQNAKRL